MYTMESHPNLLRLILNACLFLMWRLVDVLSKNDGIPSIRRMEDNM